jgi:hypothetical protein
VSEKSNVKCTKVDICDMKGSSFIPDELRIKISNLLRRSKATNAGSDNLLTTNQSLALIQLLGSDSNANFANNTVDV